MSIKRDLIVFAAMAGAAIVAAAPASAGTGCNGVINPFVWGCAPWDNNNGANFPYYKKRTMQVPANKAQIQDKNGQKMVLYNGSYYPLVAAGGGNIVAQGGGNIVAQGGGNLVAAGGGNLTVLAPN